MRTRLRCHFPTKDAILFSYSRLTSFSISMVGCSPGESSYYARFSFIKKENN